MIFFSIYDLACILPDELEDAMKQLSTDNKWINAEHINEIISNSTVPEVRDFYNWFNFELMPNIIRGINQFNMPVEVVIKHDD